MQGTGQQNDPNNGNVNSQNDEKQGGIARGYAAKTDSPVPGVDEANDQGIAHGNNPSTGVGLPGAQGRGVANGLNDGTGNVPSVNEPGIGLGSAASTGNEVPPPAHQEGIGMGNSARSDGSLPAAQ